MTLRVSKAREAKSGLVQRLWERVQVLRTASPAPSPL